mmetsp:Transcript_103514/g.297423  ORF Transcript_103514/g.297423 Transcript_103514/m.297423 type:complete len:225 (-) Transcript_103514:353-1027(-)
MRSSAGRGARHDAEVARGGGDRRAGRQREGPLQELARQVRRVAAARKRADPAVRPPQEAGEGATSVAPALAQARAVAGARAADGVDVGAVRPVPGRAGGGRAPRAPGRGGRQLHVPVGEPPDLRRRPAPHARAADVHGLHGVGEGVLQAVRGGRRGRLPHLPQPEAAQRRVGRRPRGPGHVRAVRPAGPDLGLRPQGGRAQAAHAPRYVGIEPRRVEQHAAHQD